MIIELEKKFVCRFGAPAIDKIDTNIFVYKYFGHCMQCDFCKDECCSHGVDVDKENVERILAVKAELERFVQIPPSEWFKSEYVQDAEFPGNSYTRTNARDGKCVFIDARNRGCLIHKFCISKKIDFHLLKPIVSCIFPVTFDDGLLHPMTEMEEKDFICMTDHMNLYQGVKTDLEYYFGNEFITILDGLERRTLETL